MAEEYHGPQLSRSASAPPERQYHLPARQQPQPAQQGRQSGEEPFGYTAPAAGLPPGAMAPQGQGQNGAPSAGGGHGPYPPMTRPKSAGKGSSGASTVGPGRRPRTAEGPQGMGEDDVPLDRIGGSLGRRAR